MNFKDFYNQDKTDLEGNIPDEYKDGKLLTEPGTGSYMFVDMFGDEDINTIHNTTSKYGITDMYNPNVKLYINHNKMLHNTKGPAYAHTKDGKMLTYIYAIHGRLHRLDGPAYFIDQDWNTSFPGDRKDYYIYGKKYKKAEYDAIIKNIDKENIQDMGGLGDLF